MSVEKVVTEFSREKKKACTLKCKISGLEEHCLVVRCIAVRSVRYGNPPRLGYLEKTRVLCYTQVLVGFFGQYCCLGAELQRYLFRSFRRECCL